MATDDHIGVIAGDLELFFGFEADNRLMHADMVEYAAQSIAGILMGCSVFNRLTDSNTQRALIVRVVFKNRATSVGLV